MSDEQPVVGAIVHDLAGMLSNVSAFAGILEKRPDHPGRDEFLPVLAREARAATLALQDLQLARSLADEWPRSDLSNVELRSFLLAVGEQLGHPDWLKAQISDLEEDVTVVADPGVLNGLLLRSFEVAAAGDYSGDGLLAASSAVTHATVRLDISGCDYEGDIRADVERGRRELRAFALLRLVVEKWGGTTRIEGTGDEILLWLEMPLAG
jgi:hypothetical protein